MGGRGKVMSLTECNVGDQAEVVNFETDKKRLINKLSIFGVVRGAQLQLLQKGATYVVLCEQLEFAIDEAIAGTILVHKI